MKKHLYVRISCLALWLGVSSLSYGQSLPVITVTQTNLTFNENEPPQTFEIRSSEAAVQLDWRLLQPVELPAWLELSPNPVAGKTPSTVTVSVNRDQICAGDNQANLVISQIDAQSQPIGNPLTVTVIATSLSITPSSLHFAGDFSAKTFNVRNTGGKLDAACVLRWRLSGNASWLTIAPDSLTTNPQRTTKVSVSIAPNAEFNRIVGRKPAAEIAIATSGAFSEKETVRVTVNRAPVRKVSINDASLTVGCPSLTINFTGSFEEHDGDELRYRASADEVHDAVGFSIFDSSQPQIEIDPIAVGKDTIIVFAEDGEQAVASDTFLVEVKANDPPFVSGNNTIVLTLKVRSDNQTACGAEMISLNNHFSDRDCGPLTYQIVERKGAAEGFSLNNNGFLRVEPQQDGIASVKLVATDPQGTESGDSLYVEARVSKNSLPAVRTDAVRELTLTVDGGSASFQTIDWDRFFNDSDDNQISLTYDTLDVDTSKIIVTKQERSQFKIEIRDTPVEATEFHIRATDPCGEFIDTRFRVIINHRPFVKDRIQDISLSVQGRNAKPRFDVDLSDIFDDLDKQFFTDRDSLKFKEGLGSDNPRVARSEIIGRSILRVTAFDTGRTQISVTADDDRGGKRATSFHVTVADSNHAPRVNADVIKLIELIARRLKPHRSSLKNLFHDPDSDSLAYEVKSANETIAFATHTHYDSLTVFPVRPDTTTVVIIARDGHGGSAIARVPVLVRQSRLPNIDTTFSKPDCPLFVAGNMVQVTLETIVNDDFDLPRVTLHARRSSQARFGNYPMVDNLSGNFQDSLVYKFTGTLPVELLSAEGIDYYITARDENDKVTYYPSRADSCKLVYNSIQLCFESQLPLQLDLPPFSARSLGEYRLISIPFLLSDPAPSSVLSSLGPFEETKWRFSEPKGETFIEYPNTSPMLPGKAFWFAVRPGLPVLNVSDGKTTPTNQPFKIALQHGWNYVGAPFNFTIPVEKQIRFTRSSGRPVLRSYEGKWNIEPVESMEPGRGYALFVEDSTVIADANIVDSLSISPDFSPDSCTSLAETLSLAWAIRILAQCRQAQDSDNLAAVTTSLWENEDQREPPPVGEFVSVYFVRPSKEQRLAKFCHDLRTASSGGETWDFEVISNIHDRVDLTFEGMAQVPREFEVWLVDEELQITRDLRVENQYSIIGPSPANPKRLKLVVGKKEYVGEITKQAEATLTSFELSQNFPNPFNPATEIRYGLPHAARITLRIFNMLGEEVATPVLEEWKTPGYHIAIWNGRNAGGVRVGSGVYVYKLQAGSFTQVRKMLLLQ